MKNLFQRLKPEIKDKLLSDIQEYPTLINGLLEVLENNVAVTEVKLGDLSSLSNFSPNWVSEISQLYEMFED
jgi:NADH:ubiquinone oxidoreductase subunit E